jgi:hypothetical protein
VPEAVAAEAIGAAALAGVEAKLLVGTFQNLHLTSIADGGGVQAELNIVNNANVVVVIDSNGGSVSVVVGSALVSAIVFPPQAFDCAVRLKPETEQRGAACGAGALALLAGPEDEAVAAKARSAALMRSRDCLRLLAWGVEADGTHAAVVGSAGCAFKRGRPIRHALGGRACRLFVLLGALRRECVLALPGLPELILLTLTLRTLTPVQSSRECGGVHARALAVVTVLRLAQVGKIDFAFHRLLRRLPPAHAGVLWRIEWCRPLFRASKEKRSFTFTSSSRPFARRPVLLTPNVQQSPCFMETKRS